MSDDNAENTETIAKQKTASKKTGKGKGRKASGQRKKTAKTARPERPYPRAPLKEAIEIPLIIRHKNGGNPWTPNQIADALGRSAKTPSFFYLATASRDFGLTTGTRDTAEIGLTDLGCRLAYAETPEEEHNTRLEAFLSVDLF